MGVFFYNIFLWLFRMGITIASLFHPKAKKWARGRRGIFQRLEAAISAGNPVIWMHCASLGEFEQGRPLLESLRSRYPNYRILLTFFSPSGYEIRKNYAGADWVFYLPIDGPGNARRFLEIVQPRLVIFVKYEFWYYYLKKIRYRQIPLLLVSAVFWAKMSFFRWYGSLPRKMLARFDQLFVQDEISQDLMKKIGLGNITQVSGDTRFDRVVSIAQDSQRNDKVDRFASGRKLIIAGSTWPADEQMLNELLRTLDSSKIALVLAPHEIGTEHLNNIRASFSNAVFYSEYLNSAGEDHGPFNCLVIDNIGMLSQLYRHAWVAYIGGGFGKGIHNTLEAAVYGCPVLFGPVYHKFREAKELIAVGAGFEINAAVEFEHLLRQWEKDTGAHEATAEAAARYVNSRTGATNCILNYIQEKRLLIN